MTISSQTSGISAQNDAREHTNAPEKNETILSVLAERARSHSVRHLEAAAILGAADFVALTVFYPSLWWIATGSLALSAYGVWGLADQALEPGSESRIPHQALRMLRAASVVVGLASGVAAMLGLMAVATQGWIL